MKRAFGLAFGTLMLLVNSLASTAADSPPTPRRDGATWLSKEGFKIAGGIQGYLSSPEDIPYQICNAKKCDVTIYVTVDATGDGNKCTFEGPFMLVTKHKDAQITWTLVEKASATNARFSTTDDGIRIYLGKLTKGHFKNKNRLSNEQYFWERDKDINDGEDHGGYHGLHDKGALGYLYDIYVIHDFGLKKCDVPDPIIINRD